MKNKKPFILLLLLISQSLYSQKWVRVINLKGAWKFELGDDLNRAKYNFNDDDWETIRVPSSWENQGYHGYDGYAWYRKTFELSEKNYKKDLVLKLGRIDDVDQVYINGIRIGFTGQFPPNYISTYYAWREYSIPRNVLKKNDTNLIAVRVYDDEQEGGIVDGDIGLFEDTNAMPIDLHLAGEWKFKFGDNSNFSKTNIDDSKWDIIMVPSKWEQQYGNDYDGFAWYRLKFDVPTSFMNKKYILCMGKIDDLDEVYFNGVKIGSTGNMNEQPIKYNSKNEYSKFRGYYIPENIIQYGSVNTIAVRVYDGYRDGGIYEGPIGMIERTKYNKYWFNHKPSKPNKSFWDILFNN